MIRKANAVGTAVLLAGVHCTLALGQQPPPTILTIDVANVVEYLDNAGDPSKFASDPKLMPSATYTNLGVATLLGDIVAVNGQPAKGMYVGRTRSVVASATPKAGGAIADLTRTSLREQSFEILTGDGIPIGTIMSLGFSGGPAPPGAHRFGVEGTDFIGVTGPMAEKGNWVIAGGSGAFLGARGQLVQRAEILESIPPRQAPMTEDPANRRIHRGGTLRFFLQVIPMSVPQIVGTAAGPAVTHSKDFKLVTAANPAAAGEILSLFATGLGPTVPEVDPGQSFPAGTLAAVNSPVTVTVNGKPADVLAATGYPGSLDGYQVNFRVPTDAAKGAATIQVSAAWILSAPVSIMVL
jgi:hypothetical protein